MVFNSTPFALFFILAYLTYFFVGKSHRHRLLILTFWNIFFYSTWGLKYVPILLAMGTLDFWIARTLGRTPKEKKRDRLALVLFSVLSNLSVLFFFKYARFSIEALRLIFQTAGAPLDWLPELDHPALNLEMPLGISFYTFQSLSYTIDVYRGAYAPKEKFLEFIASLTFFPHLLAGPIIRSSFLVPQFAQDTQLDDSKVTTAVILFSAGLLKKTLADYISPLIDPVFNSAVVPTSLSSWTAMLGFSAQLYGDFSGYMDMASGLALAFGYRLPQSFDLPYLAQSPVEFWKRWNSTLSSWFRDYVFFPLSLGPLKKYPYANLFSLMIIMGLWHGANWNCLLFGLAHGVMYVGTIWIGAKSPVELVPNRSLRIALTFFGISLAQAAFRSPSLEQFSNFTIGLFGGGPSSVWTSQSTGQLALAISALVFGHGLDAFLKYRPATVGSRAFQWGFTASALFVAMILSARLRFIYFQF